MKKFFLIIKNMKVYIYGTSPEAKELEQKTRLMVEELGLSDFVVVETTTDDNLKTELSISETSALIIEEESIDFKDMIFEWIVPNDEELKSMFVSIIWWGSWWCGPDGCSTCSSGC